MPKEKESGTKEKKKGKRKETKEFEKIHKDIDECKKQQKELKKELKQEINQIIDKVTNQLKEQLKQDREEIMGLIKKVLEGVKALFNISKLEECKKNLKECKEYKRELEEEFKKDLEEYKNRNKKLKEDIENLKEKENHWKIETENWKKKENELIFKLNSLTKQLTETQKKLNKTEQKLNQLWDEKEENLYKKIIQLEMFKNIGRAEFLKRLSSARSFVSWYYPKILEYKQKNPVEITPVEKEFYQEVNRYFKEQIVELDAKYTRWNSSKMEGIYGGGIERRMEKKENGEFIVLIPLHKWYYCKLKEKK